MEESLFEGKEPKVKEIYEAIKGAVNELDTVKLETKKTSIHVVARVAFLGIHPKTKWLDLNIVTVEPISSPRVLKSERVSANRFHNTVRLTEESQVDSELINWIKKSFIQLS